MFFGIRTEEQFARFRVRRKRCCAGLKNRAQRGKKRASIMTRIALVDDDSSIRRSLSRLLRSRGYECVSYESAELAMADSDFSQMDCLLIDIELFGIDGFGFRDRLRDLGCTVPHIFITAHSAADIPEWDSRVGESFYLTKPVEEHLLFSAIEKLTLRKNIASKPHVC